MMCPKISETQRLCKDKTHILRTHLHYFLDAINGTCQQAADFLVIIHVVGMSHAHEQNVGR